MLGLTVSEVRLDVVLASASTMLDQCWWYLGGHGMRFPWIRDVNLLPPEPKPKKKGPGRYSDPLQPSRVDPVDFARYMAEYEAATAEFEDWLQDGVGRPGFFSRYATGIDADWATYYASDASELPAEAFSEALARFNRVWFDYPPSDLPKQICLITRGVDAAYLDVFFRDEPIYRTVWDDLQRKSLRPREYRSPPVTK
jgi:hypothetical protein